MNIFKNKEVTVTLTAVTLAGLTASAVSWLFDRRAGLVCAGFTVVALAVFIINANIRYRRMAELSEKLDELIAGAEGIDLSGYSEGELSILRSQLAKLTVALREQTLNLAEDKKMLADSIADISHQIRTPLTAINLLLTEVSEAADEEHRRKALSELRRQISRIDWLVSALLKLARIDAEAVVMEPETVALADLVRDALNPIAIQMELKDQQAVTECSGNVTCDRSWTVEALTNILKNCSEHMDSGRLCIRAAENALYSEITVRDSGRGIDPDDLPHIFERFYKGRNSAPSSVGIGLALSRAIIVRQNGTVKAENAREGGALFTIRFYRSSV